MNGVEYNKEYNYIVHSAKVNGLMRSWWIKKLDSIEDNKVSITIVSLDPIKENTTYKKFNFHPKYNHKFQKVFKKFNITLAVNNRFKIKNLNFVLTVLFFFYI